MVGQFEDLSNWPTLDPDCAISGPNALLDFLYAVVYTIHFLEIQKLAK